MRTLLYVVCLALVMALAFWAYRENYRTQSAISEKNRTEREIAQLREDLGVLRAEWAFLNRPERLRELVALNFDQLGLVPLQSGQFLDLNQIDYPTAPPPVDPSGADALDPTADRTGRPPLRPNR
ncbi:MAG: cell division protein FtsL [Paracoccus sp. (in: a-proteobacteria)]|uniref:cell division protein FtsL n=1 Tax=Paracoccus sp. TaxID=267 RepID=UPI0026E09784|nr:cell division protein FtsL [Paracoccus sp. (in: a-proteobacteria)]MDO5632245.1 cell division protein FtsL [Paracoccus sp. (in: a-proteobacteria)]